MNVYMFTNTFTPHVGGVARSVESFTAQFRQAGHRVWVVAPEVEGSPANEVDVIRTPSIQNINGSEFSVPLAMPGILTATLTEFPPDIVHAHHPFLLGNTALRVAVRYAVPVVFTHHTLYDQYVHYLGGESLLLQKIAVEIAAGYCNLCTGVIAPSQSVAQMLHELSVTTEIEVIPTGVEPEKFQFGDPRHFRAAHAIPERAFVVGHVGRLAPEKNLEFLGRGGGFIPTAETRCAFSGGGRWSAQRAHRAALSRSRVGRSTAFGRHALRRGIGRRLPGDGCIRLLVAK